MTKELRRLYDDPIAKLRKADEGARKKSLAAQVSVRHRDELNVLNAEVRDPRAK